jgi:hypothetical protein
MASRSASVKAGWIVARAVDGAVARALIGISGVVLAAPCLRVAAGARDRRDGAAAQ